MTVYEKHSEIQSAAARVGELSASGADVGPAVEALKEVLRKALTELTDEHDLELAWIEIYPLDLLSGRKTTDALVWVQVDGETDIATDLTWGDDIKFDVISIEQAVKKGLRGRYSGRIQVAGA